MMGSMTDEKVAKLLIKVCEEASAGGPQIDCDIDHEIVDAIREASPEVRQLALGAWMQDLKKYPTYQNAALCGIVLMIDHIKRAPTTSEGAGRT